jgi:hypothetical protein
MAKTDKTSNNISFIGQMSAMVYGYASWFHSVILSTSLDSGKLFLLITKFLQSSVLDCCSNLYASLFYWLKLNIKRHWLYHLNF